MLVGSVHGLDDEILIEYHHQVGRASVAILDAIQTMQKNNTQQFTSNPNATHGHHPVHGTWGQKYKHGNHHTRHTDVAAFFTASESSWRK
jgi:hypothetical protein